MALSLLYCLWLFGARTQLYLCNPSPWLPILLSELHVCAFTCALSLAEDNLQQEQRESCGLPFHLQQCASCSSLSPFHVISRINLSFTGQYFAKIWIEIVFNVCDVTCEEHFHPH